MKALDLERGALKNLVLSALGQTSSPPRFLEGHTQMLWNEGEILRLPFDTTNYAPIQDPITGDMYFMVGISDPFGDDIIM